MTHLRKPATTRQKAATLGGLLAVACWLIVSLIPASVAAQRFSAHDSTAVVSPADQWLGVEGLRTESITAKSTIDDHDLLCVDWVSLDLSHSASVWQHANPLLASAAAPTASLLTLGICLRL